MAKLNAAARKKIPTKEFGLPSSRKYPMPDKSHARNAKARASEMVKKGRLSKSAEEKIDAKADRKLGIKEGSKKDQKMDAKYIIKGGKPKKVASIY